MPDPLRNYYVYPVLTGPGIISTLRLGPPKLLFPRLYLPTSESHCPVWYDCQNIAQERAGQHSRSGPGYSSSLPAPGSTWPCVTLSFEATTFISGFNYPSWHPRRVLLVHRAGRTETRCESRRKLPTPAPLMSFNPDLKAAANVELQVCTATTSLRLQRRTTICDGDL